MSTTITPTTGESTPTTNGDGYDHLRAYHERPLYPVAEGVKLDDTPEDFNPKTHKINKSMFSGEPAWLRHKANMEELKAKPYLEKAAAFRKEAEDWKPGAGKVSKTKKLESRLEKLEAKLAAMGVDIEELFSDDEE